MQPDPWQAQFDQQLASASKTVLISAVGIGALVGLGLGVPGIVIGGIVLVCGLGAVVLARAGKAGAVMPLLLIAGLLTLPLGVAIILYGGRLKAAARGKASSPPPPVPSADTGRGRLIVDAPLSMFQGFAKVRVRLDDGESQVAFTPCVADLAAGEHQVMIAVQGPIGRGRKSEQLAVTIIPGRVTVVTGKISGWTGRVRLSAGS